MRVGARPPRCPAGARPSGCLGLAGEERKPCLPSPLRFLSLISLSTGGGGLLDWTWQGLLILLSGCLFFPSSFHMCVAARSQAILKARRRSSAANSHPWALLPLRPTARGGGLPFSQAALEEGRGQRAQPRGGPERPPISEARPSRSLLATGCPAAGEPRAVSPSSLLRHCPPAAVLQPLPWCPARHGEAQALGTRPFVGGRKTGKGHRSRSRLCTYTCGRMPFSNLRGRALPRGWGRRRAAHAGAPLGLSGEYLGSILSPFPAEGPD